MTDNEIILFYKDNLKGHALTMKTIEKRFPDFYKCAINRFSDLRGDEIISEIIYRVEHKLEEHPKCVLCGKLLRFFPGKQRYSVNFCSKECEHSRAGYNIVREKVKQSKLERYGDPYWNNREKYKLTNLKRFGFENPNQNKEITDKAKVARLVTMNEVYGVDNVMYLDEYKEKARQVKIERYGDPNYNNKELAKQTKIERYGDERYNNKEKAKETFLKHYGVDSPMKAPEVKEKAKKTCLEKYGVDNPMKNQEIKERSHKTCLEKYGVINPMQYTEIKDKAFKNRYTHNICSVSSLIEDTLYDILINNLDQNTIRQYKSDLYPYFCDFYIPKYDLYIELQGMWTHNKHPFNPNNKEDIELLNIWKEKAETSKFYKNAIHVWTESDVLKRETAKLNNINYLEIFSNKPNTYYNTIIEFIKNNNLKEVC